MPDHVTITLFKIDDANSEPPRGPTLTLLHCFQISLSKNLIEQKFNLMSAVPLMIPGMLDHYRVLVLSTPTIPELNFVIDTDGATRG